MFKIYVFIFLYLLFFLNICIFLSNIVLYILFRFIFWKDKRFQIDRKRNIYIKIFNRHKIYDLMTLVISMTSYNIERLWNKKEIMN